MGGTFIAIIALVPWVTVQYRRRGSLGFGPTAIALATVIYALAIVTYTMLPLPQNVADLCADGGASQQWRVGQFVRDIADQGGWSLSNPAVLQVGLNVVLFVPLGMLVRYLLLSRRPFMIGVAGATASGLVVSLLIETTQLTGNWFLYPCAYRVFDVDDLLANSVGALIGGIIAPLLALIPGQQRRKPSDEPRQVSASRRFLGMFCDVLAMAIIGVAAGIVINIVAISGGIGYRDPAIEEAHQWANLVPAVLLAVFILFTGRTVGEMAVRLRPVRPPNIGQRLVRAAFGSVGWWVLIQIPDGIAAIAAALLALVTIISVWTTRAHRGFAAALSRIVIDDERRASAAEHNIRESS